MSWPTTRKHPRTLAEAYPRDHACAIERPPPRNVRRWADLGYVLVGAVSIVVLGVMLGMAAVPV
jgi:hypothetical protein